MVGKGRNPKRTFWSVWIAVLFAAVALTLSISIYQPAPPLTPSSLTPSTAPEGLYTKISDEPDWETHFISTQTTSDALIVRFYHDAPQPQPVWIEGNITYSLSTDLAEPYEEVTLTVPLAAGQIPWFRLHVGPDSEVFEFGSPPLIPASPGTCTCTNCSDCTNKLNDPDCDIVQLTADITDYSGTCINNPVNFTNKTFDCQGHTIDGDDSGTDYGMLLNGKTSNTIRNCIIQDFDKGIYLYSNADYNNIINCTSNSSTRGIDIYYSDYTEVINTTTNSNSLEGIFILGSHYNNITNCTSNLNSHGIIIEGSNYNSIVDCTINSNSGDGIGIRYSDNNNISATTVLNNANNGINFDSLSNNNFLSNNTFCMNKQDIKDYDANTGDNNTCTSPSGWNDTGTTGCTSTCGIITECNCSSCSECYNKLNDVCSVVYLNQNISTTGSCIYDPAKWYDKILDCQGHTLSGDDDPGDQGIRIDRQNYTTIKNCVVQDFYRGIYITYSQNNEVNNCTLNSNGYMGIGLFDSSNNKIINSTADSGGYYGISFEGSSNDNEITNCITKNSAQQDIYVLSSSTNNIFSNTTIGVNYPTSISFSEYSGTVQIKGVESPPTDPSGYQDISKYFEASATWLFINVSYSDSDLGDANESTLQVWKHNGTDWLESGWNGTRVLDTANNIVGVNITSFSTFAPFGSLSQPTYTNFPLAYGTTDFSQESDLSSVSQMTLATAYGKIKWFGSVYAAGEDYDSHVNIGSLFVSINASALHSSVNSSANVTLSGVNCDNFNLYYAPGFYSSASDVIAAGTLVATQANKGSDCTDTSICTNVQCSGSTLTFTAQHFDSFGGSSGSTPEFGLLTLVLTLLASTSFIGYFRKIYRNPRPKTAL